MTAALRAYDPQDFDALYEIDQACYPPGIAYSRRVLRSYLHLPGAQCLTAVNQGLIIGFILADQEGESAHLITLDVVAEQRRRRVGTMLLTAIEHLLASRGAREIQLETATDNQAAVAFWTKHGYRIVGVLRRYYLDRLDAYWMHKLLDLPKES